MDTANIMMVVLFSVFGIGFLGMIVGACLAMCELRESTPKVVPTCDGVVIK